ncbi:MAG: hypothetical protein FWG73_00085 [Planctomycetaceae bacterium]|nr:hypothetical protein [Planctomycetaceae bacterium]
MGKRRKLETILIENNIVSNEQLQQIVQYAHAVGIDLHEAVLQKKIASPDAVMMAYAESIGLPFIHIDDVSIDTAIVAQIDPMTARQNSFLPISADQGHILLATTKPVIPDVAEQLRLQFNMSVRCVICTPAELSSAIAQYYPRDAVKIEPPNAPATQKPVAKPKAKPKAEPVEPMNDEDKRDRLLKVIASFNFTVAGVFFGLSHFQIPRVIYNSGYHFLFSIILGILIGAVVGYFVLRKLSR